jgi:hemolysin activation/secretion protein
MNTVTQFIKAVCLFLLAGHTACCQQNSNAKTFTGFYGGIDFNANSFFKGAYLERIIHRDAGAEFSVTGSYTVPYSDGNLGLLSTTYNPSITKLRLGVQGYSFKNKKKIQQGYFFTAGAGLLTSTWEESNQKQKAFSPYGELGFGWKWPISKKLMFRLTNTIGFNLRERSGSGGVLFTSVLALGF